MKKAILATTLFIGMFFSINAYADCQHQWSEWEIISESTCVSEGYKARECGLCYEYQDELIPATGVHEFGDWEITDPECSTYGYKIRWCNHCSEYEDDNIPPTGNHSFTSWETTEATCIDDGYKSRYCTGCYLEESTIFPATGQHSWSDWDIYQEPTCTTDGYKDRECEYCSEYATVKIPATGIHSWSEWITTIEPDCMNKGKAVQSCEYCGKEKTKKLPVDTSKHDYGKWYTTKKATAFSKGKAERECYICQKVQTKSLAKLKTVTITNKTQKQVVKTISNLFTYAKSYNTKKIKSCFVSPSKVKLFSNKTVSYVLKTYNKKYLKYAIKSVKVSGKKATVKIYCQYRNAYDHYATAFFNLINNPNIENASSKQIFSYYSKEIKKVVKKSKASLENKTITINLKKVSGKWKISKYTSDLKNVLNMNYGETDFVFF